jgi:hypothetical protein
MNPLMSFALAHPEQPPLHHLEGVGLQVDQEKQQPILGGRQWTVLVGRVPTGRARPPVEAPVGHMGLERRLTGGNQLLKLVHRETGQIEHLCRAGPQIGKASRSHRGGLLSLEAQDTINRD